MMPRKVLLLEPNYKNKYPPMGLMKLATYFRARGDIVRFFKGDLRDLAVDLLFEDFWLSYYDSSLGEYTLLMRKYIREGRLSILDKIPSFAGINYLRETRNMFKNEFYPKFDIICITTLFTFYWKITIDTINQSKKFLDENGRILVGGIASTILHKEFEAATGIKPYTNDRGGALLDKPGQIDKDDGVIIDDLPLDYSILLETSYKYPVTDAYFSYMTRGCINRCSFCAVPRLEPGKPCQYKSIKFQILHTDMRFGMKKDLLLLDNNVLASPSFNDIIDEIKELGFAANSTMSPANEYSIAISNIKDNFNPRAYVRFVIDAYDIVASKLPHELQGGFYIEREKLGLLYYDTATIDAILSFDSFFSGLYDKYVYSKIKSGRGRARYVDFNQGLDARLLSPEKMKKLSEINIRPLRIAFDHWDVDPQKPAGKPLRIIYSDAIRLAAHNNIKELSNYLIYNTNDDTPDELYLRLELNVMLCEELNVNIYSFPMKYHPIDDPNYFDNRNFIGKHWCKKYVRAIQAILNSTNGKVGRGKNFFHAAFGKNLEQFHEILLMPETFIIERHKYDHDSYKLFLLNGGKPNQSLTDDIINKYGLYTSNWRVAYSKIDKKYKQIVDNIIYNNDFSDDIITQFDNKIRDFFEFYRIQRYKKLKDEDF